MKERLTQACEAAGLRGYEVTEMRNGWWAMTILDRRIDVAPTGDAFVNGDTDRPVTIEAAVQRTREFLELVYRRTAERAAEATARGRRAAAALGLDPPAEPLTVAALQRESFETAKAKGWHDDDDQEPSEAVRLVAERALAIRAVCADIEEIRRNGTATPMAKMSFVKSHTKVLSPRQVRTIAWLGLLCTEVAEAIDDVVAERWEATTREDGKPEGLPSEMADILIRACDSAGALGIDLEAALRAKIAFNRSRPYRHGGKAA